MKEDKLTAMTLEVEAIIARGEKWTDEDFYPSFESLYEQGNDYERSQKDKFTKLEWKRASEIYENPVVFDDITPGDIKQGMLGDCYFLAVLSAMAEFPERIQALFVTKEVNQAGVYLMKFYINGIETPVMVDAYFPCYKGHNQPAFAYSREGELWVSLLEKGWAKLHGTFARIEGGLPCHANTHVSGAPSESMHHSQIMDNLDSFW